MKLIIIIALGLCLCSICGAQPFHADFHMVTGAVSLDFFTIEGILSNSLWYSTIMPSYQMGYQYNFITGKNNYHKLQVSIRYFESNTFTLNSAILDPGAMRILKAEINADYMRYLPFTSYLSFLTGFSLTPDYYYFGQIIGTDQVRVLQNYLLHCGPIAGLSFYIGNFLEIASFIILQGGFPLSGNIIYPDKSDEKLSGYSIKAIFHTGLQITINMFVIGLEYDYRVTGSMFLEKKGKDYTRNIFDVAQTHSPLLRIGVRF
ncbi:MAG: hypothetical protein JXB88_13965 [Spirochaetales bacterium]|nr:hypothetical protein [Spirochaetales bacterium]